MRHTMQVGWLGAACVMAVISIAAAAQARGQAAGQTPARGQLPAGWKTQQDPMGFSVTLPPGWSARGDRDSGRIELSGPGGAAMAVWPVFLENARLDPPTAGLVAQRLMARLWPEVVWTGAAPVGANAVRLAGRRGDALVVSAFAWAASPKGTAGNLYAVTVPTARYAELADTFARILGSFRVVGAPSAGGAATRQPAARYAKWMDPRENAFTLDVPEGWRTEGGMFRFASNDTRIGAVVDSPDGQIHVQIGDAEVPPFTEPSQMLSATGFQEGTWYSPGYGLRMLVRRFLPAPYFLNEYVRAKMGSACQQLQVEQPRDRPDTVQTINAINARYGVYGTGVLNTGGEVSFTCERNGQPYRGYFFAMTQLTRPAGMPSGIWNVTLLAGYLAAAPRADEALAIGTHVLGSLQMNPQWQAMQDGIVSNTSKIVSQANAEISNMISEGYERRRGIRDEMDRRQDNVNRGREDVVDTANGEQLKIESGSNYYWMDNRGDIVGTDTHTVPGVDFHELLRQP